MRRYRNVRFGDSPKGAQLRKIAQEIDRKAGQVRPAIKTVIEWYKLWKKAKSLDHNITDDGWIDDRWFGQYLQNIYDSATDSYVDACEDTGTFEDL